VLIETSVLARILRLKLLTLEGTILVSPAQVQELEQASAVNERPSVPRHRIDITDGENTPSVPQSYRRGTVGARLSDAACLLKESKSVLGDLKDPVILRG
jgi:hypothetical protein